MSDSPLDEDLSRVHQAAADAMSFVDGLSQDDFLNDKRTQQAVVMSLLILGETAGKLMDRDLSYIEAHPQIPWRNMRGMRNRIAHGYFDLDLDVVWENDADGVTGAPEASGCSATGLLLTFRADIVRRSSS